MLFAHNKCPKVVLESHDIYFRAFNSSLLGILMTVRPAKTLDETLYDHLFWRQDNMFERTCSPVSAS